MKKDALHRERQLKKYRRQWKENLINETNPDWKDLYEDFLVGDGVVIFTDLTRVISRLFRTCSGILLDLLLFRIYSGISSELLMNFDIALSRCRNKFGKALLFNSENTPAI